MLYGRWNSLKQIEAHSSKDIHVCQSYPAPKVYIMLMANLSQISWRNHQFFFG